MYLLIVTGLSGSGKSSVLKILEDDGYYCVDNLPVNMLSEFVSFCRRTNPDMKLVAVSVDAREYKLHHYERFDLSPLRELDVNYEILYIDSRDDVIAKRYNATRRQHPMSTSVLNGIEREREFLSPLRDNANYILDTTNLRLDDLRTTLFSAIHRQHPQAFSLILQSFGYKNGVPFETDIVYDMRFIRNPYYEDSLRDLTGLDEPIIKYINGDPAIAEFMDMTERQIRFLIPKYIEKNKRRLMISFGCTGGRHRSVYGANEMYKRLMDDFQPTIIHRDVKGRTM